MERKKHAIISYVIENGINVDIDNAQQLALWRIKSYIFSGVEFR